MSKLIIEVCEINQVKPLKNCDNLEMVQVKGWNCIVRRDSYKVGDLVIYCPPDSIIPDHIIEQYKLDYLKKNGRVGTIKLRGYISQGLILNIPKNSRFKLGQDVKDKLGIKKYEPPLPSYQRQRQSQSIKTLFIKLIQRKISLRRFVFKSIGLIKDYLKPRRNKNPLFTIYTDIENIKHYNNLFTNKDMVVITEKVHGTNFRASVLPISIGKNWIDNILVWIKIYILKQRFEFVYGSHRVQITGHRGRNCFYGEDVYGQIAQKYKLAEIIPPNYILYGEIYGKGIQKGYNYGLSDSLDVVFFDLKKDGKYVNYSEFKAFCQQRNLPIVPELYIGQFHQEDVQKNITGTSVLCPNQKIREGCVVKSYTEEMHLRLGRKILKCINPEYLLIKDRTDYH